MPVYLHFYPPFSFYRGLYLLSNACQRGVCMTVRLPNMCLFIFIALFVFMIFDII